MIFWEAPAKAVREGGEKSSSLHKGRMVELHFRDVGGLSVLGAGEEMRDGVVSSESAQTLVIRYRDRTKPFALSAT